MFQIGPVLFQRLWVEEFADPELDREVSLVFEVLVDVQVAEHQIHVHGALLY